MLQAAENRKKTLILGSLCFATLFLIAGTTAYSGAAPGQLTGKQVFEQKCLHCHKPEKFTSQNHDRRGWEQILSRMELNTCILTDAEATAVADYLVKEHGD